MELKKCPNCKKDLPLEARFCPYCMTKLIQENGEVHITKSKRKRNRILVITMAILILIAVSVIGIVAFKMIKPKLMNSRENSVTKENVATKDFSKENTTDKYANYLGTWCGIYVKNIEKQGGEKIEICKVNGDTIIFCISKVEKGYSKVAAVDYVEAKLVNGEADFNYTDDGNGNAGQGTITLKDNKIHATVKNSNSTDSWNLAMDTDFYLKDRLEEKKQRDIKGFTGQNFEAVKGKFGQLTKKEDRESYTEYQFENSIYVRTIKDINTNQPLVIHIKVLYDKLPENLNIGYRGISNKTNKTEVEQKLSDYWIVDKSDDTQTFQNQESFDNVEFYYDSNGYVKQINYS